MTIGSKAGKEAAVTAVRDDFAQAHFAAGLVPQALTTLSSVVRFICVSLRLLEAQGI